MILIGRGLDLEEEIWKRKVSRELVQGQEPVKRGRKPERLCSFEGVETEGREAEKSGAKEKRKKRRGLKRKAEASEKEEGRKKWRAGGSGSGGLRDS